MNFLLKTKAALVAVFLYMSFGLTGCSVIDHVADAINDNPHAVNVVARQAVSRYAAAGKTIEEERERAASADKVLQKTLLYLDENAESSPDELLFAVDNFIEWESLTLADQILVLDIMSIAQTELTKRTETIVSHETRIALSTLIKTMISAAQIYLRQ